MKTWAALCVGLCLLAGPVWAQDDTDKSEAAPEEVTVSTPADSAGDTPVAAPAPKKKSTESKSSGKKEVASGKKEVASGKKESTSKKKEVTSDKTEGTATPASTDGNAAPAPKKTKTAKKDASEPKKDTVTGSTGNRDASDEAPKKVTKKKPVKKDHAGEAASVGVGPGANDSGDAPKKNAQSARSGTAIVKEGGKTCSGLDEYRICW